MSALHRRGECGGTVITHVPAAAPLSRSVVRFRSHTAPVAEWDDRLSGESNSARDIAALAVLSARKVGLTHAERPAIRGEPQVRPPIRCPAHHPYLVQRDATPKGWGKRSVVAHCRWQGRTQRPPHAFRSCAYSAGGSLSRLPANPANASSPARTAKR
jgi:hypothetical protein